MPLNPRPPLAAAFAAGILLLAALPARAVQPDAQDQPDARGQKVLYCTGCLCDEERPRTAVPGAWVPSGTIGAYVTLRFVPREPDRRLVSSCRAGPPPT